MAFKPENKLEEALVAAVEDSAAAPDFYRLLLESNLLVPGTVRGHEQSDAPFTLSPDSKLDLIPGIKDGQRFLPAFTSVTRLQAYLQREMRYLTLNTRTLLEVTRGAPVILNPASDYGREFTPAQIAQLLDPKPHLQPQGEPMRAIGEVDFPPGLVEALTALFAARPQVAAAWMIQVTFADRAKEPHPLVSIETAGDWLALVQAINAAAEARVPGMVFDIQRVVRASPTSLTQALLSVPPFYDRDAKPAPGLLN